jgi:hypothetical protein
MTSGGTIENVESKLFTNRDFRLESGVVLPELHMAARLDADKWAPALRAFLDGLARG